MSGGCWVRVVEGRSAAEQLASACAPADALPLVPRPPHHACLKAPPHPPPHTQPPNPPTPPPRTLPTPVVTCGGLCPGLNDVVQGLVSKLTDYGVPEGNVMGIRWVGACCRGWKQPGVGAGRGLQGKG